MALMECANTSIYHMWIVSHTRMDYRHTHSQSVKSASHSSNTNERNIVRWWSYCSKECMNFLEKWRSRIMIVLSLLSSSTFWWMAHEESVCERVCSVQCSSECMLDAYCDYPAAKSERKIWMKKDWERINEIVYTSLDWFHTHACTGERFVFFLSPMGPNLPSPSSPYICDLYAIWCCDEWNSRWACIGLCVLQYLSKPNQRAFLSRLSLLAWNQTNENPNTN